MQRSIYLAKLIGPVFIVMSLAMLLNGAAFRVTIEQFLHSYAFIFIAGMLAMPAGLAIVLAHNVWTPDWRVIITIVGWLGTIGGAARLLVPQVAVQIGTSVFSHAFVPMIAGFVLLVAGCVLAYFGYADSFPASAPASKSPPRKRNKR